MAAPIRTLVASGSSSTDATTLVTTPVTLFSKRLYLLQISIRDTAVPSAALLVGQEGVTWELVGQVAISTGRLWLYRAQPKSDAAATIQISNATADGNWESILWSVTEYNGVLDDASHNGAGVIGPVAINTDTGAARTTLTNTVGALRSDQSIVHSAVAVLGTSTFTVDAGYTEFLDHTVATTNMSQAAASGVNDISSVWTFTSLRAGGIAVEIKPATVYLQYFMDLPVDIGMPEDVKEALLLEENRKVAFRYEVLKSDLAHSHWVNQHILAASVTNNTFADIKRTASFKVTDSIAIDWMSDRIRPWMLVLAQPRIDLMNLSLPGTAAHYSNVPYVASQPVSVTGDFEIRIKFSANDYSSGGSAQVLVANGTSLAPTGGGIFLSLDSTGLPVLGWSNGSAWQSETASANIEASGHANGKVIVLRARLDADNGAAGRTVTFDTSVDDGVTWQPLGTPKTTAGTTAGPVATTANLVIGADIFTNNRLTGNIYRVEIADGWIGAGGETVVDVNYTSSAQGWALGDTNAASGIETYGRTVRIWGAGTKIISTLYQRDLWAAWPLGVFLPESPERQASSGVITREVEAYDQLKVLHDHIGEARFVALQGSRFTSVVAAVLADAGIADFVIEPSDAVLPINRDWEPGTNKLHIINDLLGAMNYRSLYFDSYGVARCEKYFTPEETGEQHVYFDDEQSIYVGDEVTHNMDLFNIANKWVLWVSELETELFSVYENVSPNSPTSTFNRKRVITDFRREDPAVPDQASLDALARRYAQEASQVLEIIEVDTRLMPNHSDRDVIRFRSSQLGVPSSLFAEHEWSMELVAGAKMRHRLRKIVIV